MTQIFSLKRLISFVISVTTVFFSIASHAKEVNLYDQPKDGSKLVGKIDTAVGVVPIFTQPDGVWMKVGDPKNGNVGWIKTSDMTGPPGTPTSFTFSQKVFNDKNGVPQGYQILQSGTPSTETNKQMLEYNRNIMQQQKQIQETIQSTVQNMMKDLNTLYNQQQKLFGNGMPVIMPIVVFPQQEKTTTDNKAPQTTNKK